VLSTIRPLEGDRRGEALVIAPPLLPLVLWRTPPGLELALRQEGVAFVVTDARQPLSFRRGRFVLYDGRIFSKAQVAQALSPDQTPIDVDELRRDERADPFARLLSNESAEARWQIGGVELRERIGRVDRRALRERLLRKLRSLVFAREGVWVRVAPYPYPYRSAFNFRVDLDEPYPEDYFAFARARGPIDQCTTHFVSTAAYGDKTAVLADLRGSDTQSHGHFHHVYRERAQNSRNLARADTILRSYGFTPTAFAGPGGRWNKGLADVLEELGYDYSSEFQVGHDDLPFWPWTGDRFSTVLQVPTHPVCEGLFLEAGVTDPGVMAAYFVDVLRRKVEAGQPAFLYGHPERRLGRFPEVVSAIATAALAEEGALRVGLSEFATWWRWRSNLSWSVAARGPYQVEVHFDEWDARYPIAVEVVRAEHVAKLPIHGACTPVPLDGLVYERRHVRADGPSPLLLRGPSGLKAAVRRALDWELVTPLDELPSQTWTNRLKWRLRRWKGRTTTREGPG
jgi:hypothetical protein